MFTDDLAADLDGLFTVDDPGCQPAIWTAAGGNPVDVVVFFDNPYRQVEFGTTTFGRHSTGRVGHAGGIAGREPVVQVIEADFPGVARLDLIEINGATYRVKEPPQPDGLGTLLLLLSGPIATSGTGIALEDGSGAIELEDGSGVVQQE